MSEADERQLDDEQRAAVHADEHAIAVLAGPGSGKTRTLSHRARHLLRSQPDTKALLLTFTNKAAAEMKNRAVGVAAVRSDRLDAGTFHSFGMRLLRSHGAMIGLATDFEIMDDIEAREFAATVAVTAGVDDTFGPWQHHRLRRTQPSEATAAFGAAYQAAKLADEVVDFDDLVVYTADLLNEHEELARAYGGRYAHLLVDEFQDTNAVQFDIVQAIAPHTQTVSVFADDDQAIFRFVGAETANIRRFVEALGAVEYPLTCNYRSRQRIVDCANALIAADPRASGRTMRADKVGGEVDLRAYDSVEHEAEEIADEVEQILAETSAASIAMLVRSGYRANELVTALHRRGVPVTDWRGDAYEPQERRTFATAMSALRGTLTGRRARNLCALLDVDETEHTSTHEFLNSVAENPVAHELLHLRQMAFDGAGAIDLARQAQIAVAAGDPNAGAKIAPLVDAVADFVTHDPEFSVDDLLSELALGSGGRPPTQGGGVRVATLHKTKGLQWPIVYLLGLEEGHTPDYRSDEDDLPDERRACFVGVCRAEDRLVLTFAQRFRTHQRQPSRFLAEMGLASGD